MIWFEKDRVIIKKYLFLLGFYVWKGTQVDFDQFSWFQPVFRQFSLYLWRPLFWAKPCGILQNILFPCVSDRQKVKIHWSHILNWWDQPLFSVVHLYFFQQRTRRSYSINIVSFEILRVYMSKHKITLLVDHRKFRSWIWNQHSLCAPMVSIY